MSESSGAALETVGSFIHKVEHMPQTVGLAWLLSSAIYTTYATNRFLEYEAPALSPRSNPSRKGLLSVPAHKFKAVTRPTLLTICRFGGSLLLGLVAHTDFCIMDRVKETIRAAPAFFLPAVFLFTANFSNAISLHRIGISLTYTSKCAIPLITAVLSLLIDGPKALPHGLALASLLPIACGIAAASWHSPTFEGLGFAAAMLSATAQSALNVSSKRAMLKAGIRGASSQRVMVAVGLLISAIVTAMEIVTSDHKISDSNTEREGEPIGMYIMAVTAYHIEYVLSFMFVKLVSPVTYGACDAVRRLSIILSGRAMFGGKPLTPLNIGGIGLALLGALCYSIATSATKS